jgi:hypothetical protein
VDSVLQETGGQAVGVPGPPGGTDRNAVQVPFELADGQEREIIFRLGVGRNTNNAGNLVHRFRGSAAARGALEVVWEYWKRTLMSSSIR